MSPLENYLTDRSHRVVLNGKTSPSQSISAEVPQGLIIGTLLFLNYVSDIKYNILSIIRLFSDDTALIKEIDNPVNNFRELNNDNETLNLWPSNGLFSFLNIKKVNI